MGRCRAVLIGCALALTLVWPTPDPAPAVAQPAADEIVLVDETFDNPDAGELAEQEKDGARFSYEDGAYVIEGVGELPTTDLLFTIFDVVADGTIAFDFRLRGPVESRYVFIGCRDGGNDEIDGYSLAINLLNGALALVAKQSPDAGGEVLLTDVVVPASIRPGNRTNRLELSCIGSTITARVNDVEVLSVTDDRFQQGHFNAGIGLFSSSGPVEGVFDNLLVTMIPPSDSSARRDAREFAQLRDDAQEQPSLFGPAAGEVRHDEEQFVSDRLAGLDAHDIYARATFVNPYDADEQRWDAGIAVRISDEQHFLSIFFRSTGRWYVSDSANMPSASGLALGMAMEAGDENTIEVAVVDEIGYLALNGEFLGAFDASAQMTGGDVFVGTAFIREDVVLGDRVAFRDFEVWGLGDDAAPPEPADGQPRLPRPRDPDEPAEPTDEPAGAETVTVELHDMDQSGRSGQATLTAEGEQTKIALRVRDAPGETLVVLQEGPCTALAGVEAGFTLSPLNDAGVSVTRIDAELDDLLAEPHAIVVYDYDAASGIATLPLVCGEITG